LLDQVNHAMQGLPGLSAEMEQELLVAHSPSHRQGIRAFEDGALPKRSGWRNLMLI
jgi:hypothetical protein